MSLNLKMQKIKRSKTSSDFDQYTNTTKSLTNNDKSSSSSSTIIKNLAQIKSPNTSINLIKKADIDIDVKLVLNNYANQQLNSKFEYDYLLTQIKQRQQDEQFIQHILISLKECIQILEPKQFEGLIGVLIFDVKWHLIKSNDLNKLLNLLQDFLIDLSSAYAQYIYKCLTFLIKIFLITNEVTPKTTPSIPTQLIDCVKLYDFSHNLIISLIKISPACKAHVVKLVDQLAPYINKDTCVQDAYIKNLLRLALNIPQLQLQILEICIQKMLKIDVNAPRDQIINAEIEHTDEINMQIDEESSSTSASIMKHAFADRLDVMMLNLFDYIKQKSFNENEINWNECKLIYKDLLYTFDRYILRTYGSSHVQFLLFYICSYRTPLSEGYLDYLWKKFSNPNTCPITRQLCTYYIGSYLSRANYIPLNTIIASMQLMITWLHNYIDKIDASKSYANIDLHRTFYALCQTIFYVFIFRHRELCASQNLIDTIKSWKFSTIISSKLNPLRFCLPTITKKFATLTRLYQLAYCYTIIDTNNRLTLPSISDNFSGNRSNMRKFFNSSIDSTFDITGNTDGGEVNSASATMNIQENPLDSFFPFDPYLLNRSKTFIENLYQHYNDNTCNEDADDDEELSEDDDDDSSNDECENDDNHENKQDNLKTNHNPWSDDDDDDNI